MIDHSQCEHERTSRERAKCRRAQAGGEVKARKPKAEGEASVKVLPGEDDRYGQTPGNKMDECHVCGVEKSEFQGTDAWTKLFVLVGEKCAWRVKRADDFAAMTARR